MDGLISRQAALEKVRAMQTYKLFVGDDMILVDKAEVQTELMMLPTAQPEAKWIPCSERMPKLGETVLTFDGNCICVERRIEWIDTPEGQLDGEWWIDGYDGDEYNPINLRDGTAIAWMPLPNPWKGADDER